VGWEGGLYLNTQTGVCKCGVHEGGFGDIDTPPGVVCRHAGQAQGRERQGLRAEPAKSWQPHT
jgi:hypothetical protein